MSLWQPHRGPRPVLLAAPVVLSVLVGAGFLWELDRRGVDRGFPLDDSWIHMRFAANLAAGRGFGCNPGEPTPGATAPLWPVLLAAAARAGLPLEAAAVGLGLLLNAAACVALMALSRRVVSNDPSGLGGVEGARFWAPFGVGVFFALTPCALWSSVSGLEIPLFMALSLAGMLVHDHAVERGGWRWLAGAALLGLATHARPEGHLLFAAAAAERIVCELRMPGAAPGRKVGRLALYGLLYAAVVSPYTIFCLATTGRPLPNTYYAKAIGERNLWSFHYVRLLVRRAQAEHFMLMLFAPLGAAACLARRRFAKLPLLWVVALPLGYTLMPYNVFTMAGGNFTRYFYPVIPLLVLFAVHGIVLVAGLFQRRLSRVAAAGALCLVCSVDSTMLVLHRRDLFVTNVSNINELDVAAGKWLGQNTPPDARLCVCDAGAIPYFSDRYIYDTVGLVTPSLIPLRRRYRVPDEPFDETALGMFLARAKPDYLVIFPNWYPKLAADLDRGKWAQRVKEFHIADNITCGGDTLVVYRLDWVRSGPRLESRL